MENNSSFMVLDSSGKKKKLSLKNCNARTHYFQKIQPGRKTKDDSDLISLRPDEERGADWKQFQLEKEKVLLLLVRKMCMSALCKEYVLQIEFLPFNLKTFIFSFVKLN